jgi:hypothetical protein
MEGLFKTKEGAKKFIDKKKEAMAHFSVGQYDIQIEEVHE